MDSPHSFTLIPTLAQSSATGATAATGWPSPEQQQGIAALSALDDSEIFTTVASLRLIAPSLTNQHLGALVCLRSAPDDHIKAWLDWGRRFPGSIQSERSSLVSDSSDNRFSSASWSTNYTSLSDPSSLSQAPMAIEKLELCENGQDSIAQHNTKTLLDLNKPQPPTPQGLSDSTVAVQESSSFKYGSRHDRWCTTREHKTIFTTYQGFAKHEKEHDTCYVFLPKGPIENTPWGLQCALCEMMNPSQAHLEYHKILQYDGRLEKAITRSRKGNFEKLLKRHKASDEKIRVLLDKWCHRQKKKAYSCGFCISIFTTLAERTTHIDREHYAKGKHINDWDDTVVIKGLLLQRDVHQECARLFLVDPSLMEARISWPPSVVETLQLQLELGEETAKDLAKDVFRQANTRGTLSLSRSNTASSLPPRSESMNWNQASISTQMPTSLDSRSTTGPMRVSNQGSDSFNGPQAQNDTYSNDLDAMNVSHMSVSSPPSNLQPLEASSKFSARSSRLAARFTGNAGLVCPTPENVYEAAQILPTSQRFLNILQSQSQDHAVTDESDSLERSYIVRSMLDFDLDHYSSFNTRASEAASHTASQVEFLHDDACPASQGPSITGQAPKRKLSDKTAKEANLRAQTQAPVSIYNQQCSTNSSGFGEINAQPIPIWRPSF
ncbi:hypothetical protein N7G274_009158 [Stereocaulon virgatum]|uniref:C2H2-type domain-containing protein n=1 Tax=Stereocaulon virgatum TaxID=373712 RepID=A0ABR3ZX75_9LECA